MSPRPLDRLLRQVSETETDEISCSECFELLPAAVEHELSGAAATPLQARLAQHLGQCGVCREEYEVLRDLLVDSGSVNSQPEAGRPGSPPASTA